MNTELLRQRINFGCHLTSFGYIFGWIGAIGRTVLVVFFITTISNLTEDDPSIYSMILASILTLVLLSLIANLVFILGICKKKKNFMLPYMAVVSLEVSVGFVAVAGLFALFLRASLTVLAIYLLCISLLFLSAHCFSFFITILLFKKYAKEGKNDLMIQMTNFVIIE
ncbi:uncharacterized protein LOC132697149 [Cylas formicarius]|uniref:uncharacterized protein LOC132697149 n=1 Tax=Cylas formicarius TaxID=197179 RepID=UPI002958B0E3|nr:uncharacterized protein LOC132697149 [Cylas formicarius]